MCRHLHKIRRKCGDFFIIALISAVGIWIPILDSPANAGTLKNSVRVGDRSRMHIVRPPSARERNRIRRLEDRSSVKQPRAPRKAQHTWFWKAHDVASAPDPLRWETALATVRARREQGLSITPSNRIAEIADKWRDQITLASRKHKVSEILLLAVMTAESLGKANAKSPKGAEGLMQLIPATAARFGVADSFDPAQNINGGAAYLSFLLEKFNEDPILALAGYNAGENAVTKHGGVPPYVETRDYVPKVIDALAAAESLCIIAPAGPRRSCLWRQLTGS